MRQPPANAERQSVEQLLARLRRRIRWYVGLETLLRLVVFVGLVFWVGLVIDWMFEPPPQVRMAAHTLLAVAAVGILVWWGARRWMVGLPDRSLALLIERKHPELQEVLTSAVDLRDDDPQQVHPVLARRTLHAAADAARGVDLRDLLNRPRLRRFAVVAVVLAGSIAGLAVGLPAVWRTYTERLALSPDPWPRTVDLSIAGFQPDGQGGYVRKVPRNADVPLVVTAALTDDFKAPERVVIRYRWQEGGRGRDDLVRIGDAVPGRDPHQRYEYLFERIASDVEFEIRGGDDRLRRLRLEVVERPKVTELRLACTYPEYLDRAPRSITAGPRVELPEGTRLEVVGSANKPLEEVRWRLAPQTDAAEVQQRTTDQFRTSAVVGQHDIELQIELLDRDGIVSAEPFRVNLAARRDLKPQVLAVRDGIGSAVTSIARLPVEVTAEDDHAIDAVWVDVDRDGTRLKRVEVRLPRGNRDSVVALPAVDLRELATELGADTEPLAAGQRLTLTATATDKYDLDNQSRAAAARPLSFEVVTEEELMSRLASSEQNLRHTFEAVADKLLLFYDSLEKLGATLPERAAAARPADDLLVVDTPQRQPADAPPDEAAAEQVARESARLAETARQIADEVLGVASGFETIDAQLANNRIENSELSDRIGNRIARPLRTLGEERMAAVADRVAEVPDDADALSAAQAETRLAIAEVESLLREMQGLEDYNEVIAMLRDIIRQQEQINTKTKERQKSELRDLLID